MEEEIKQTEIRLSDLWVIFKKCWWLMLAVVIVVAVAVGVLLNATHEDAYTAQVGVWAIKTDGGSNSNSSTSNGYYDMVIATNLVNDYKLLATSDEVLSRVIKENNWVISVGDFKKMVSVTHESNTRVLYLSVTTPSAESAQIATESWARIFCDYITELRGEEMIKTIGTTPLPEKPSNPVSTLKVLLIAFVAAVLVYAVYFLRFIMDDKINGPDDVEKYLNLNVLGAIPNKHQLGRRREKYGYYYASNGKSDAKSK